MAPAFDNGTSLGAIIKEDDLQRFTQAKGLQAFIENGRHHYGWISGDRASAQHINLCKLYAERVSSTRATMRRVIDVSNAQINDIVSWCCRFNFAVPFSDARAQFVAAQLMARRDALAAALGD